MLFIVNIKLGMMYMDWTGPSAIEIKILALICLAAEE